MRATEPEQEWIRTYLSFANSGWGGKARGKRVTLFSTKTGTFPGGLLALVRDAARRDGIVVEELDRRIPRITEDITADLDWLRPYQLEAVNACAINKRGIVRAPTGSGKGDMIVGVTKILPGRWLFLVHRDSLIVQQSKRYKRLTNREPNVLSRTSPSTWRIVQGLNLMTLQSLAAGIRSNSDAVDEALSAVDGVVIDECHVAPADVYFAAIQRCPAEYRLGFSGTPLDRTDNRSLMAIAAMGKVIYSIKATELIEAGVLAAPEVTISTITHPQVTDDPKGRESRFQQLYRELISTSDERNDLVVSLARAAAKPCMVFVKEIDHGHELRRRIEGAGMAVEFVWGDKKTEQRAAAVERLERGDADVMVASVVFQEGIDIPSLASVVVASGGKSIIAALQRIGRGMRTNSGAKMTFEVHDILDRGSAMLEKHSRKRMNTYVREGYQTVVRSADGAVKPYTPKLLTRRQKRAADL